MPALQVRDFPEELYEELRNCATRNHRSIAQQTIEAVELMLNGDSLNASVAAAKAASARVARGCGEFNSAEERDAVMAKRKAIFEWAAKCRQERDAQGIVLPSIEKSIEEFRAEREARAGSITVNASMGMEGCS